MMAMTMTKKELAKELGYEYLGKGVDSYGDDGFCIRKIGESRIRSIANSQAEAYDWLYEKWVEIQQI